MKVFKPDYKTLLALPPDVRFLTDLAGGMPFQEKSSDAFSADLIKLARYHKLTYFLIQLSRQDFQFFTEEQNEVLNRISDRISSRALMQLQELITISNLFRNAGISFVVLKGPQLSRMLYGKQALKESVDLDIMLTDKKYFAEAEKILAAAGYKQQDEQRLKTRILKNLYVEAKRQFVFLHQPKNIAVDLHLKLSPNSYLNSRKFKGFFDNIVSFDLEGCPVPILPPEKYLVFLCHHAALHQFSRLGWINDIRKFMSEVKPDISETHRIARNTGTERSLITAILLINKIFGDNMPEMHCEFGELRATGRLAIDTVFLLKKDTGFLISFRGRIFRLRYLLRLNRGLRGKIDVFTGLFLRTLLKITG